MASVAYPTGMPPAFVTACDVRIVPFNSYRFAAKALIGDLLREHLLHSLRVGACNGGQRGNRGRLVDGLDHAPAVGVGQHSTGHPADFYLEVVVTEAGAAVVLLLSLGLWAVIWGMFLAAEYVLALLPRV